MTEELPSEESTHAGSADSSEASGYVYVATNPAMPGIVKIGRTSQDDPESRISQLFNTSVPVPFDLQYAAAVPDDTKQVENALHVAFGPQRVHPNREFFNIDPEQAIAVLKLIDAQDITDHVQEEADSTRSPADRQASRRLRRPNLDFGELGLAPGTALTFDRDDRIRVEIADARQVRLTEVPSDIHPSLGTKDGPTLLSPLTKELLDLPRNVRPSPYWRTTDGHLLKDLYEELHG